MFKHFICAVFLLVLSRPILAQEGKTLYGVILDSITNIRISNASIDVVSEAGDLISKQETDPQGAFKINLPLKSSFRVFANGYYFREFYAEHIDEKEQFVISLKNLGEQIDTVDIYPDYKIIAEVDKLVYLAKNDKAAKDGTALNILGKLPLIEVFNNDKIHFNGKEDYVVFVNGKKNLAASSNLALYLDALEGDRIEKIELMANASSKYDAEGSGSVINIILKQPLADGYTVSTSIRGQSLGLIGGSINSEIRYKFMQIGLFLSNSYQRFPYSESQRTFISDDQIQTIDTKLENTFIPQNYGVDMNFKVDSLNTIGVNYGYSNMQLKSLSESTTDRLNRVQKSNANSSNLLGINYQRDQSTNRENYFYIGYQLSLDNEDIDNLFTSVGQSNNFINYNKFREHTAQFDYVFGRLFSLFNTEFGAKAIFRSNASSQLSIIDSQNTRPVLDYDQNIYSAYLSSAYALDNFEVKVGLRAEKTFIHFNDYLAQSVAHKNDYLNMLPAINLLYKFSKNQSLSSSYHIRIGRPSIIQLNPTIEYHDLNSYVIGNPNLKPIKYNNFEINYSKFGDLDLRIGYRLGYNKDGIQTIMQQTDSEVFKYEYANIARELENELNFYASRSFLSDKLDLTINSKINNINISGYLNSEFLRKNYFLYSINSSGSYSLSKGQRLSYYFNIATPRMSLQSKGSTFYSSSIGYSKAFENKLRLSLTPYINISSNIPFIPWNPMNCKLYI